MYQGGNIARITGPNQNPDVSYIPLPTGAVGLKIVRGPDDNMWFTEPKTSKIAKLSTSSLSITEYPTLNTNSYPYAITAGQDGALWFTESHPLRIGRITTGGAVSEYTDPTDPTNTDGEVFQSGEDIAPAPDGSLWITVANSLTQAPLPTNGVVKFVY
jgi:virginiamycin B lyase